MPSTARPSLTFGVEFEFTTPVPDSEVEVWVDFPTEAARMGIAEEMVKYTSLPIACMCNHPPHTKCPVCEKAADGEKHGLLRIMSPASASRPKDSPTSYFTFKEESLFHGCHRISIERDWPGVEMTTPAFAYGELQAGLPAMKEALSALRSMAPNISADQSCGLHVHVGSEQGMTLLTAKKVVSLVMVLEKSLLFPLCAPSRINNPHTLPVSTRSIVSRIISRYPLPPRQGPSLQEPIEAYLPSAQTMTPGEWNGHQPGVFYRMLEAVWATQNLQGLCLAISQDEHTRAGLALVLRDWSGDIQAHESTGCLEGTPSTLEFRYAQMSFDVPHIHDWIEVVTKIVELAHLGREEYKACFESILAELGKQGIPVWQRLMGGVLQLEHRIPDWKRQVDLYGSGVGISHLDEQLLLKPEGE